MVKRAHLPDHRSQDSGKTCVNVALILHVSNACSVDYCKAEPINIQMLECHVDHGVEDVVVLSNTVWVKAFGQTVISLLGDVPMSEFIQVHVAKLRYKAFEVLIGIEFEFASVG